MELYRSVDVDTNVLKIDPYLFFADAEITHSWAKNKMSEKYDIMCAVGKKLLNSSSQFTSW